MPPRVALRFSGNGVGLDELSCNGGWSFAYDSAVLSRRFEGFVELRKDGGSPNGKPVIHLIELR
jgi:hypothetical protein